MINMSSVKCCNCNKTLVSINTVKYCSYECRVEDAKRTTFISYTPHALDGSCDNMVTHGKHRKRPCLICGEEFESQSLVRKYCSPKCKREGSARSKYINRKLKNEEKVCQKKLLSLQE